MFSCFCAYNVNILINMQSVCWSFICIGSILLRRKDTGIETETTPLLIVKCQLFAAESPGLASYLLCL